MKLFDVVDSIFKNNPNNVMVWSLSEKRIVYHNDCILKSLGYEKSISCPCTFEDFINIVSKNNQIEVVESINSNQKKAIQKHITLVSSIGKPVLYQLSVYILNSLPDFKVVELIKSYTLNSSISKDYLVEDDLKSIISLQTDGIGILDENENFRYANTVASKIFGCYPDSLIGRNLKEFLTFENIEFIKTETSKRKHGESSLYELQIRRVDGKPCFIVVTATPKFDESGKFVETIGIFRDITDKKKAQEELIIEQNKIKSVLNSLQDMIFIFDSEGYFVDYLQSDNSRLLTPPEFFIGKNLIDVLPPQVAKLQLKAVKKINQTGKSQSYDYPIVMNNVSFWYSAQVSKIKGNIFYKDLYIGVVRDITERKKNEEKTKKNAKALEKLNDEKNKLISIMAHDLKNPFSAMLGMAEMLNKFYDTYTEDKKKEYIEKILLSTKNIQYLLENTLQWSLSEQNRLNFLPEQIDFHQLVEKLIVGLQIMLNQKDLKVKNNIPFKTFVTCDEQMMRNVLINLITNAYKYSFNKGVIEINYSKTDVFHVFSVIDYGIGISKEHLKSFFVKGSTYSKQGTQGEKGTGLGLLICKEFVLKHGGKIGVNSVENSKTEFFFTLPFTKK